MVFVTIALMAFCFFTKYSIGPYYLPAVGALVISTYLAAFRWERGS
jgi:hypothetical protein